jgi:hypothetical protein
MSTNELDILLRTAAIIEEQRWRRLEDALGVRWTKADFVKSFSEKGGKGGKGKRARDVVRVPLAVALKPELIEWLRGIFDTGDAKTSRSWADLTPSEQKMFANAKEIADLPKEEALALFKAMSGTVGGGGQNKAGTGRRRGRK